MKTMLSTLAVSAVLLISSTASADDNRRGKERNVERDHSTQQRFDKRHNDARYYNDRRYNDHRYDRHNKKPNKHAKGKRLRLDIPVHVRGDSKLHLRQLARHYHGIDTDNYRLVKVVVDNHSRRKAAARLRVGQHVSDLVYLSPRREHIPAPRGYGTGRWVLKLDNARVSNVRLVLEPRYRHAGRKYSKNKHHHADYLSYRNDRHGLRVRIGKQW